MKTLLVPVDFTSTSENAVDFAIHWSKRYDYKRIILLKTFYDSMFENLIMAAEYSNMNQDYLNTQRDETGMQLKDLCHDVASRVGEGVKVSTAISEEPLLRAIMEVIQNEKPELIIAGSDNYHYSSESFIAANLITIAKASPIRVLVVPAEYTYKPVEQSLLPYNFNMLNDLEKLSTWRTTPYWEDVKLLVLNIDPGGANQQVPQKFKVAEEKFQNLLKNFEHEVFYTNDKNVINGIANFTKENPVQLIIAMPGKYSFLYNLTHQNISEAIYRNARQPVLILK